MSGSSDIMTCYGGHMLFSRRSATSACAIVLIVMAVTPYHRFSSSIGLASGAMTWLVILGACLAAFGHGVALRKGREIRRPGRLGVFGVFLAAIAVVPEWVDLAFYARGDSIPIAFAPIWLLHGVSCALCFTGSLLLSCVSSRGLEQKEHRKLSSRSIGSAHAF
jgi:hypothetical protein